MVGRFDWPDNHGRAQTAGNLMVGWTVSNVGGALPARRFRGWLFEKAPNVHSETGEADKPYFTA
jgi:hypothetical protein